MWVGLSGKARFPALQTAACEHEDAANTSVLPHRSQVPILDPSTGKWDIPLKGAYKMLLTL